MDKTKLSRRSVLQTAVATTVSPHSGHLRMGSIASGASLAASKTGSN